SIFCCLCFIGYSLYWYFMISRTCNYSCKHLSNGVSRIYINNHGTLVGAGYREGDLLEVSHSRFKTVIRKNEVNSAKSVMGTARGLLIELRDKKTRESFEGIEKVIVTISSNCIVIEAYPSERRRVERVESLKIAIRKGMGVQYGSLYSGLGLLAYNLSRGFKKKGVKTFLSFANDIDDLALSCSVEGNPIWDEALPAAEATSLDIRELALKDNLPKVNFLEIGLPCTNQSKLCPAHLRDLSHPSGTLFMSLITVIRKMNPAVFLIENSKPFLSSMTYKLLKKELDTDYAFESVVLNGHSYGDFEPRERACIIARDRSLPATNISDLSPPEMVEHRALSDILQDVPEDSPVWRTMSHVKRKEADPRLNFKNSLYSPTDVKIGALMATYASPKIGSPMVAHPTNSNLQRQFSYVEHCRIRRVPKRLEDVLHKVATGMHCLVRSVGSKSAVHRMCGNSVAPLPWRAAGSWLATWMLGIANEHCEL
ncbi:DNA cytosine methyltransferase, partial [Vibrio tubiashii]|uniref:DNA cytosine methyltransferase n=1 Tax=Vibrio tubiashii TaxID=29498 RepID=UPI001EFC5F08